MDAEILSVWNPDYSGGHTFRLHADVDEIELAVESSLLESGEGYERWLELRVNQESKRTPFAPEQWKRLRLRLSETDLIKIMKFALTEELVGAEVRLKRGLKKARE